MHKRQHHILASMFLVAWLLAAFTNASAKTPAGHETPGAAATADQHTTYLPMIKGSRAPLPPAMQAINAALKAGTIDLETALLYKAQAVLEDPALPAPYQGDVGDSSQRMMGDVRENFANISPAAQARLRPYLLPPSSTESWYAQHVMSGASIRTASTRAATQNGLTWKTVDTANGKARIWYHPELAGQAARAQHIAAELDRHIWAKVAELFGRDLAPDCGASCAEGGGDGRLDIYMLDRTSGWTGPYGCCDTRTGWIQLGRGATFGDIVWAIATAWADTFPVASRYEYTWLRTGAAIYAIDYVYPTTNNDPDYPRANEEHRFANLYMEKTWESLETFDFSPYLFFLHRALHDVDTTLVQRVFANAMNPNSIAALDAALDGRLGEHFEDWGTVARRTFCKDNTGEEIINVVLIASNGQWKDREQVMDPGDGMVESEAQCSSDVTGSLTYRLSAHFKAPLSQLDQEETLQVNVRLSWDEESQGYVDDGSTYMYNSTYYSESYSADRSNGAIHEKKGNGNGSFASTGSNISGYTDDDDPRLFELAINNILYDTNGTIKYLPSGHQENDNGQGRLYPMCGNPSYWTGKETAPHSNTFDMACTETVNNENGTSMTSISGTLNIKR